VHFLFHATVSLLSFPSVLCYHIPFVPNANERETGPPYHCAGVVHTEDRQE
jgi:hypothetical protein